jgi:hypothetical protein
MSCVPFLARDCTTTRMKQFRSVRRGDHNINAKQSSARLTLVIHASTLDDGHGSAERMSKRNDKTNQNQHNTYERFRGFCSLFKRKKSKDNQQRVRECKLLEATAAQQKWGTYARHCSDAVNAVFIAD